MARFSACVIYTAAKEFPQYLVGKITLTVRQTCCFQTNEQISSQKTKNSEQEEVYKVKKKTMDLLPDAENNIAKLQVIIKYS